MSTRPGRFARLALLATTAGAATTAPTITAADVVVLKNGTTYRGLVDKDEPPLVTIFDEVRRIFVRDTKVAKIQVDEAPEKLEQFLPQQPMIVSGGVMPAAAINISASPFDELGRRTFKYTAPRMKRPATMSQGIVALNPQFTRYRGIDGYWQGRMLTSQVPKASTLSILGKLDQSSEDQRLRVVRFLLQAGWYPEAKSELARLSKDFPGLKDKIATVRQAIADIESRSLLAEIDARRAAGQPAEVRARLKAFPTESTPAQALVNVRDSLRRIDVQAASDSALSDSLRRAAEALPAEAREAWKGRTVEILRGLAEVPEAVRDRLDAFIKADAEAQGTPESRAALAFSGWVVGADAASASMVTAAALWNARELVQTYLRDDGSDPAPTLAALDGLVVSDPSSPTVRKLDHDLVARIVRLTPPPIAEAGVASGKPRLLRVRDDPNPDQPTEYSVLLPPEYHPLRSYPMIVALHGSSAATVAERTGSAIETWAAEATRRGFVVIAPEYTLRDQPLDYRYTPSEAAAVELAIRDARRRFAVDSDRIFLAGTVVGANMAWDFGLGHPDQFAGVAVVSGLPAKYVWGYRENTKRVPFYIVEGEIAPAESQYVLKLGTDLIGENYDVTFVEFYTRGMENFPEEIPAIVDWMDKRRRDPLPKSFEVRSARSSDDRFYGVVPREFAAKNAPAPEAVDPLGRGLTPATIKGRVNNVLNLYDIHVEGIKALDVWVPVGPFDFSKKLEVRVNDKAQFKAIPTPGLGPMLDDLRVRGDRKQLFGMKVAANQSRRP